jgi:hypothetical protein
MGDNLMKPSIFCFYVALLLYLTPLQAPGDAIHEKGDQLIPANEYLERQIEYDVLWKKCLLVTPGGLGRMVVLPQTSRPEYVISLYKRKKENEEHFSYYLSLVSPSSQLYQAMADDRQETDSSEVSGVRIFRKEIELSDKLAVQLQEAWQELLSHRRRSTIHAIPDESHPIIYFSVGDGEQTKWGEVPAVPSREVQLFIELGFDLAKYISFSPASRPQIEDRILKEVSRLLNLSRGDGA